MKAQLSATLHALTALHAPPGFEQPVELLDINDAVGTVRVLVELCRTMGGAMQTIADVWA